MKKAAILPVIALFSVMLASCILFLDPKDAAGSTFYAQNMVSREFYEVKAEMLCEGAKCEIWAETGSGVTKAMAENIAREYDNKIRPCVVDAFSEKGFTDSFNGNEYHFGDMLDYANWLADRDNKKLTILLLDIQDGFKNPETDSYVAGYFWAGNFYSTKEVYYSNGRDMIYVDTYPGLKMDPTQVYATFAHELQHLVNFVTGVWMGKKSSTDTWVNEGLSAYAEYLYLGKHPDDRCGWLKDKRNTIKTGNNFFVWGNHSENPLAILDDYATVYLFFQWLYLQADAELQSHIFRDIAHSNYSDYRAVADVAVKIKTAYFSWPNLLRTWLAANYYPENTDYGYKGDEELQEIIKIDPLPESNMQLFPGEGVYSIIGPDFVSNAGNNIRYVGIAANTAYFDDISPHKGDILLTFNANTDNSKGRELGSLTGVPPPPAASQTAADNARQAGKWNGPYVIDAQDMLGRDRDKPLLQLRR